MSYDIRLSVKVQGCDKYAVIAEPEYPSPTYNLGQMFRACMDWDYDQCEKDASGEYRTVCYRCDHVLKKVTRGINELHTNRKKYEPYEPGNGWGTIEGAIRALESLRECILEQAEEIPIECLYMSW